MEYDNETAPADAIRMMMLFWLTPAQRVEINDAAARALDGKLAVETATGREVLFPSPEDVDAETNGGGFRPASRAEALAYAVEWAAGG